MTTNTYGGYTVAQLREFIAHTFDAEHGGDTIDELTRDTGASANIVRDLLDAIEPQQDGDLLRPIARWVYNAVRVNLDLLHGICGEFGCPQGADVATWLRARLAGASVEQHAAPADGREPVDEVLDIVSSYGPYGRDINEGLRFQIVLADEVKRLRAARSETNSAVHDVFAERRRQIEAEGWTPEHDDHHADGSMALAAACYAVADNENYPLAELPDLWPWDPDWWKPSTERRNLVKAGALILAEIERLDRNGARAGDAS
ncbi:hypothetical protein [Burkholderia cenocepacia]|uniref:hypothetical protein n=1 Tax=Burkholderia cenocepacia TaxID=95486 RepID=UPI001905FDCC|nr:hypothetical protein [Burkholderia cenocepacia]MBJ9695719.1 hypothetical protein [Burkholderia cenocepacia]